MTRQLLDASSEFQDVSCEALAALLVAEGSVFVEIEIFEDLFGVLTATEVEAEVDDHDEDEDEDEDEEDDD